MTNGLDHALYSLAHGGRANRRRTFPPIRRKKLDRRGIGYRWLLGRRASHSLRSLSLADTFRERRHFWVAQHSEHAHCCANRCDPVESGHYPIRLASTSDAPHASLTFRVGHHSSGRGSSGNWRPQCRNEFLLGALAMTTEPNQALEPTTLSVTLCAPSRTDRAS